jgi:hypothetical protein
MDSSNMNSSSPLPSMCVGDVVGDDSDRLNPLLQMSIIKQWSPSAEFSFSAPSFDNDMYILCVGVISVSYSLIWVS